jgi:Golgi apparatus protein 1
MDTIHGYRCSCPPGYGGDECQLSVNHCSPNPCQHDGNCTITSTGGVVGYKCSCPTGFTGATCETNVDDCHGHPCKHGGTCVDQVNSYRCQCVPGYTGDHCEEEVNLCLAKPCANGGTCVNLRGDFECRCRPNFTGRLCFDFVDKCATSNPCRNGGTCFNGPDGGAQCECPTGYGGARCEDSATAGLAEGEQTRRKAVRKSGTGPDVQPNIETAHTDWSYVILAIITIPAVVITAVIYVRNLKKRNAREKEEADNEARMQNEQNSVHSIVTMRGDTHMIKNTWGQCAPVATKDVDADNAADLCYPKQVSYMTTVPTDPNVAPVYTLERTRSHKLLNRGSCKDNIVRTNTSTPLDNRWSVLSINISQPNLR